MCHFDLPTKDLTFIYIYLSIFKVIYIFIVGSVSITISSMLSVINLATIGMH